MISEDLKRKISLLCDVPIQAVVSCVDADNIYQIPSCSTRRDSTATCSRSSRSPWPTTDRPVPLGALVEQWPPPSARCGSASSAVRGPSRRLPVVVESLRHAGFHHGAKVEIEWVQAATVPDLLERDGLRSSTAWSSRRFGERASRERLPRPLRREHDLPLLDSAWGSRS